MTLQISKRLQLIASELSQGTYFVDIGSDHAYLPCYVCLNDQKARAIAGEVAEGPYSRALATVSHFKLNERIDVRLGNGLQVIKENELVKEIVIAGMGGSLISSILLEGINSLYNVNKVILQPNNNETKVRKTLRELNFTLTKEFMIEENELIYEVLVAEQKNNTSIKDPYNKQMFEKQLFFGPYLMYEKSPVFIKKWTKEKDKILKTIKQMERSQNKNIQTKIRRFKEKVKWIEEAIS